MKKFIRITIRVLLILLAVVALSAAVAGICLTRTEQAEDVRHGVLRLPTTTKDTGPIVNQFLNLICDITGYAQGRCSAVAKTISNGDTIVGRNFDMTQSKYPLYIGTTDIEGFYPTVYVTDMGALGPTYDAGIEKGIPKYISISAPFYASDSLNSEGLYIETNMRQNQKDEDGNFVFSCPGTNKASSVRILACALPSYVTMRCKNTEEAVALVKTLDIYTTLDAENWTFCFMIADAEGNYGLLELGCNEVRWLPGQSIQTNYYVSEDFYALQIYRQGLGRYEYLEKNMGQVDSEADMLKLMEGVKYSEIYNIDTPKFDIRSEYAAEEAFLTNEYLDNDENWAAVQEFLRAEVENYRSLSQEEKEEASKYWVSLYTTIVNCNRKTLSISFAEEYDISCVLSFD